MNSDLIEAARLRAQTYADIRSFFRAQGLLEVDPPSLAATTIPESTIPTMAVHTHSRTPEPHDTAVQGLTLLPSPERYLKKLIGAGAGSLYSISHAFRDAEETGPIHAREFTMLEWYLVHSDEVQALTSCRALLEATLGPLESRVMSMDEAFVEYAGAGPGSVYTRQGLRELMAEHDLRSSVDETGDETDDELFQRAFLTLVEPELPHGAVYITDYPRLVPSLAEPGPEGGPEGRSSRRWELYVNGVELANCYMEERDPSRIRDFMAREFARMGVPAWDVEPLVAEMSAMPPCAGVAMGVDRLIMLRGGYRDINSVLMHDYG